jgi:DNA-binding transcriptional LysR family regulator
MDLKELTYITTIAEEKNISNAAKKLFISQPALSLCLSRVEENLGSKLFSRTSNGLILTYAGEIYVDTARKIIKMYENMIIDFSEINNMKRGRIVLGISPRLGSFILPVVLTKFSQLYPNIKVALIEDTVAKLESKVIDASIDLAILNTSFGSDKLHYEQFTTDEFLICSSATSELKELSCRKKDSYFNIIDLMHLKDKPFILTHPGQSTRIKTDSILLGAGITPNICLLTTSIITACHMCADNNCVTLVPKSYCQLLNKAYSLDFFCIEDRFNPYWIMSAAYNRDVDPPKPAREFIRLLKQDCHNLF